jgi:hypothetical protein
MEQNKSNLLRYEFAYGHIRGFSCAYRDWDGSSHNEESALLHGYALSFFFRVLVPDHEILEKFKATISSLIENYLEAVFRNTVLVAKDDPALDAFVALEAAGACDLRINDKVGLNAFARDLHAEFFPLIKSHTEDQFLLYDVSIAENGNCGASFIDTTVTDSGPPEMALVPVSG